MNWAKTSPTEPGWYEAQYIGGVGLEIVITEGFAGELVVYRAGYSKTYKLDEFDWIGRVPAPGTNFAMEEIREWILGELIHDGNGNEPEMFKEKNRHTRFLAGYLDDKEGGIAAVTERHRKENK